MRLYRVGFFCGRSAQCANIGLASKKSRAILGQTVADFGGMDAARGDFNCFEGASKLPSLAIGRTYECVGGVVIGKPHVPGVPL
jgi:hypothetical protein